MATVALTRRDLAQDRRTSRAPRVAIALLLLAGAGALVYFNDLIRSLEALASAALTGLNPAYELYAWRDQIIFEVPDGSYVALRLTAECTSLVILVPLVVFAAATLVFTRVSVTRWFTSLLVASLIIVVANLVRVIIIAVSLYEYGMPGYAWTHTVVGTGIIMVATIIAIILMLRIQSRRKRHRVKA